MRLPERISWTCHVPPSSADMHTRQSPAPTSRLPLELRVWLRQRSRPVSAIEPRPFSGSPGAERRVAPGLDICGWRWSSNSTMPPPT
ncbi:hypothetical protein B0T26DRAFT_703584 [Lasiosphaeria miniovina]|uniref:Uncharacterized protein n=1 Tax=Lasiosphaeria miniovina TaxID=1954250 RepID=A0AA40AVF2_9PEZI|nr:uncharacterized protein B0T26DRAFT_703584 [Lasiosphaeria miniovina]KAK0722681.1 hypothetical protein B0T26DRAFT_703584 [Lasiosphaeria miniovina]